MQPGDGNLNAILKFSGKMQQILPDFTARF